jgi:hypothetical protein
MVQREVDYVVNNMLISGGDYRRSERSCNIDYEKGYPATVSMDSDPAHRWYIARLACTIVHEATHGRIYSFGIPYNKKTRVRIERLCVLQARRFATHQLDPHYDFTKLVPPFDAAQWEPYWNPKLQRKLRKALLIRLFRELRAGNK